MNSPKHILVSRTDRAGDLVLTLPVFSALRRLLPDARLTAHVRTYTAPLLESHPDVDDLIIDDSRKPLSLLALARLFHRRAFYATVLVHPSARAILAAFLAGIPLRVGRASNVWQFFLNRPQHQHRSLNEKHEYEYNLDLLQGLGLAAPDIRPRLFPSVSSVAEARTRLQQAGLAHTCPVFMHPGHGGSAFNLAPRQYAELANRLLALQIPHCVTFGPGEGHLLSHFGEPVPGLRGFVQDLPDLGQLAALLSLGRCWVGGSTGPMHLAAALQLPVAAFFPPLPAMTPKRWGPVGAVTQVFLPTISSCPRTCSSCVHHPCMSGVNLEPALNWICRHAL